RRSRTCRFARSVAGSIARSRMRSTSMRTTAVMVAMLAARAAAGPAQEKGASWLDAQTPASWNTPGLAIPPAPKVQESVGPRCRPAARPPQGNEDKQVARRGWDLVDVSQGGSGVVVVRATAGYDGMCRPLQYQDFAFVNGVFAGTLSPHPMDSRTDG